MSCHGGTDGDRKPRGDVTCDDRVFRFARGKLAYQLGNVAVHSYIGAHGWWWTVQYYWHDAYGPVESTALARCATILVLVYVVDILACKLDQGMMTHHGSTFALCLWVILLRAFVWDGVLLSKWDQFGRGYWRGGYAACFGRASFFEAVYFGCTALWGPGWQHRGRAVDVRCALTILDDGWQIVGGMMYIAAIWSSPKLGNFPARVFASTLALAHSRLLLPWVWRAIKKLVLRRVVRP